MSDTNHRVRTAPPERDLPERDRPAYVTRCCSGAHDGLSHPPITTYGLRDAKLALIRPRAAA